MQPDVIEVRDIHTSFGPQQVHRGVSFNVRRGTVSALIGASGCGKSVLLREIIGLQRPDSGSARVLGIDIWNCAPAELAEVRQRTGMLFQNGALFSALSVADNVAVPLRESTDLQEPLVQDLVDLRLALSGLRPEMRHKRPAELSGGMLKRAALARALALEPEVLFLDEPTSGLDPITARGFDSLVRTLVRDLGITVLMVTHDLDSIYGIVDQLIVLSGGRVLTAGTVADAAAADDAWLRDYFAARTPVPERAS